MDFDEVHFLFYIIIIVKITWSIHNLVLCSFFIQIIGLKLNYILNRRGLFHPIKNWISICAYFPFTPT